jgi:kynurenine formamidase
MALIRRHGDRVGPGGESGSNELITLGGHVGTHIDALAHVAKNGVMHGGVRAEEAVQGGRYARLGVDTIAPMICRGILLDIPAARGVRRLQAADGITAEDMEKALGDLSLNPGDVALVRTGWPQLYADSSAYVGQQDGAPGMTTSSAQWLAEHKVRAAGADTIAFDQVLPGVGHSGLQGHRILLIQNGINIIEVLNLEELAADSVREFLFVLTPLKILGATGSPVRPVAVVTS